MSNIFYIYNKEVRPKPNTLLIPPFKDIWERDKSKEKEKAIKELSYIEFMTSVGNSNPYHGYPDKIRHEVVIIDLFGKDSKWKPDNLVKAAMTKLHEFQLQASPSYSYYLAAKNAVEKIKGFYDSVDFTEKTKSGMPLYKPAEITRALNDTEKVIQNLIALKKKVDEEILESAKTKGGKEISPFADPASLNKRF